MRFDLYTEICFNQNIDEYSIQKGDIGTIVEYCPSNNKIFSDGYSIEIFDAYGDTIKVVTVDESKLSLIRHNSVLSVREFEFA
jgi:hypothetical protein